MCTPAANPAANPQFNPRDNPQDSLLGNPPDSLLGSPRDSLLGIPVASLLVYPHGSRRLGPRFPPGSPRATPLTSLLSNRAQDPLGSLGPGPRASQASFPLRRHQCQRVLRQAHPLNSPLCSPLLNLAGCQPLSRRDYPLNSQVGNLQGFRPPYQAPSRLEIQQDNQLGCRHASHRHSPRSVLRASQRVSLRGNPQASQRHQRDNLHTNLQDLQRGKSVTLPLIRRASLLVSLPGSLRLSPQFSLQAVPRGNHRVNRVCSRPNSPLGSLRDNPLEDRQGSRQGSHRGNPQDNPQIPQANQRVHQRASQRHNQAHTPRAPAQGQPPPLPPTRHLL